MPSFAASRLAVTISASDLISKLPSGVCAISEL
jgi:hypothetical protein